MECVGTALGDSVDHAAAGLSKLGVGAVADDLEFLNDVFTELERDTGASNLLLKEGIVIVRASTV